MPATTTTTDSIRGLVLDRVHPSVRNAKYSHQHNGRTPGDILIDSLLRPGRISLTATAHVAGLRPRRRRRSDSGLWELICNLH